MPRPNHRAATPRTRRIRPQAEPAAHPRNGDTPEFVERLQAECIRRYGAPMEEVARDPDVREVLYSTLRVSLGEPALFEEIELPMKIEGVSLSDAVIEERRGFPMPWREPAPDPKSWRANEPLSTRETDPPEFVARVQAEARRRLGGSLEEVVPEPELQEIMYNAIAGALRQQLRPVAPEILALAARLAEDGIILTPGSGDVRDLPTPINIPSVTLSGAVIEERHGYE